MLRSWIGERNEGGEEEGENRRVETRREERKKVEEGQTNGHVGSSDVELVVGSEVREVLVDGES